MSELLVLRRPRPPAIVPPLLSFTAGFIDSFTVLALGLFVAQVTGSYLAPLSGQFRPLPLAAVPQWKRSFSRPLCFPLVSGRFRTYTLRLLTGC